MSEQAGRMPPLDRAIRTSIAVVAVVAALLGGGAYLWFDGRTARGVAIGGLLATANLLAFTLITRGLVHDPRRARLWAVAGAVKMLVLLAAAWLLLASGWAGALEIAVGYCALPVGVTGASLLGLGPPE